MLDAGNILHGDLTAGNVLLAADEADFRGFTAKVRIARSCADIILADTEQHPVRPPHFLQLQVIMRGGLLNGCRDQIGKIAEPLHRLDVQAK